MKNNIETVLIVIIISIFTSCNDYFDVDTDKDRPVSASTDQLMSDIMYNTSKVGNFNFWTGDILQVYTHQFTAREEMDQYGTNADFVNTNNEWSNIYRTLNNIEDLIEQASNDNDRVYVGIGQILKVFLITSAVDIWGDVPFSEASRFSEGIVGAKFDEQATIYNQAFELIETAIENIASGEGGNLPSSDDFYYLGNTDNWIKLANTFKLKLYNQVRLSSDFDTTGFTSLINEDNFFESNQDDFEFKYTANQAPSDERNELYRDSYGGAQVTKYLSPWFYEIMMGMNQKIHTDNKDPRIPYYWVNQLTPNQLPRDQGNAETGDPNADYWDASTGFFSIRFASIGPDRDHAVQSDATFPGIFPCGGRYDDGEGFARTGTSGTGVSPKRILTYDEFLYIQAELIQVGLISGDAKAKLTEAMLASFEKVDKVVSESGSTQTVEIDDEGNLGPIPTLSGREDVDEFISNIQSEFDNADDEGKLEIIMTQKWVATFGDPLDQYNDYRRTGYPTFPDPNGNEKEYQLDNGDGFPLNDDLTNLTGDFQLTIHWPQREVNLNANAPSQKDPTTYKVFWDN